LSQTLIVLISVNDKHWYGSRPHGDLSMPNSATIVAGALSSFSRSLKAKGIDQRNLGRAHGVADRVWTTPDTEIPLHTFVSLYEAGSNASGLADLGWTTGETFDLRDLGAFGEAVLAAPTLGAAYRTFEHFLQLVQSESELRLIVEGDQATIRYRILNPDIWPRRQDAEFTLSILIGLLRRSAGAGWTADDFIFEHAPARREQVWNETVGAECRFCEPTNGFSFPVSILELPMPESDPDGYRNRYRTLNCEIAKRNRSLPVSRRVSTVIFSRLGTGPVDADSVAQSLGLSRRTMHRRLVSEETGYADILDDCRYRLARRYLADPQWSLSDIAFALSYSDQSAFGRAFRRRTGMTPQEYRVLQKALHLGINDPRIRTAM